MIERIIAIGPKGAGAVAMDLAIKLGLDHGGWMLDDDAVAEKYQLQKLSDNHPDDVVAMAVKASDGVLIFVQDDDPASACKGIRQVARKHNRPLTVIDVDQQSGFMASRQIAQWFAQHSIQALYVDGVYNQAEENTFARRVASILEASLFLAMMETGVTSPLQSVVESTRYSPLSDVSLARVDDALDHLEKTLSLKDKATIANMVAGELASLHFTLGDYINRNYGLFTEDSALLTDCRRRSGQWTLEPDAAAAYIIRQLWERLRDTHRIRIIK